MIYTKNPSDTTKIKQQRVILNEPTKKTSRVIKNIQLIKKREKRTKRNKDYMGQIEDKQQDDISKFNHTNDHIKWSKHPDKKAEIVRQ